MNYKDKPKSFDKVNKPGEYFGKDAPELELSVHGILQKLQNDQTPEYRAIFCDIFGNHAYGDLVKLDIEFTEVSPNIFKFERTELDGTGIGMAPETQAVDYYGVPKEGEENKYDDKSDTGYFTVGETFGFARLTTTELSKKYGFVSCTKRKGDSMWSYANCDLLNKTWIQKPKLISNDEAIALGVPVKKMGDSGTYSCYYIDVSRWEDGIKWFTKLKEYTENIYMNFLNNGKYEMSFTLKTLDGNNITEVLKGKEFCIEDNKWKPSTLNVEGKAFDMKIGRRPKKDSEELINFDIKYPNRRALQSSGMIYRIARHPVIILMDKDNGFIYSIISHTGSADRLITIIYVSKSDLVPETNKSKALLKGPKTKKKLNQGALTQKVNLVTKNHFDTITDASESELMAQFDNALKGKTNLHLTLLDELYEDLNDDIYEQLNGDNDKLKLFFENDLQYESNQDGNEVDMVISICDWLMEGKPKPPETDDFDQIVKYITFRNGIKRMTIVAVSDPDDKKAQPFTKQNHIGFPKALVSRFTTELKAKLSHHEDLKDLKINMIDLRYYGLHKIL